MTDWRGKLTSRKFWTAVVEFVTMWIIALGGDRETAVRITALIMAGAAVIAYIVGEGLADAAGAAARSGGGQNPPDMVYSSHPGDGTHPTEE